MVREAEELIKSGLTLTKRLHKDIGDEVADQEVAKRLKTLAAETNKLLVKLRRQMACDVTAVNTRESVLKQVLKEELIDRDANAARVSERQRLAYEKSHGFASLAQRSDDAVRQINTSIASLCPWQIGISPSVPMIAAAQAGTSS